VAEARINRKLAATHRLIMGVAGIALTSVVGSIGVFAAYYPLRNAAGAVQWLLVFLLMTGESASIHLPSEVILPVAGWLIVRQNDLGLPGLLGVSASPLGKTLGSSLLYIGGRHGGRPLVRRYGRYFLIDEASLDALVARMQRHHTSGVLVSRLLPVVRTYSGFVAGLMRVPWLSFVVLTFAGSLLWSLAFAALGLLLGYNWQALRGPGEIAGGFVIAALLLAPRVLDIAPLAGRRGPTGSLKRRL
jgi:membrane protein DedA with SNARE-associated domain